MLKRLSLLTVPIIFASCAGRDSVSDQDYLALARFDPSITTIQGEAARNTGQYSKAAIQISPGKYCQGFVEDSGGSNITARLELVIRDSSRFALAGRYTYKNLVKSNNAIGNYLLKGNALIFIDKAGHESSWPVTKVDGNTIHVWGSLPLSRDACTQPPMSEEALRAAMVEVKQEQSKPAPWQSVKTN